jgi:hypothetical protein
MPTHSEETIGHVMYGSNGLLYNAKDSKNAQTHAGLKGKTECSEWNCPTFCFGPVQSCCWSGNSRPLLTVLESSPMLCSRRVRDIDYLSNVKSGLAGEAGAHDILSYGEDKPLRDHARSPYILGLS